MTTKTKDRPKEIGHQWNEIENRLHRPPQFISERAGNTSQDEWKGNSTKDVRTGGDELKGRCLEDRTGKFGKKKSLWHWCCGTSKHIKN